ncbi:hypothetical protein [Brevundimonas naejangsanensis]|nr:hypothetical protein [Brevundimonas naejangsanensis]
MQKRLIVHHGQALLEQVSPPAYIAKYAVTKHRHARLRTLTNWIVIER